jgi:Phospholipase_D-nuclease N-terminal
VLIDGGLGLGVVLTALWVYCVFDVIMCEEHRVRNLPKLTWLMIVLFTFEVGAVAWLVAGRPQSSPGGRGHHGPRKATDRAYPEYDRPGRFAATNPDDDEAFLRQVRERAEAQRQEAKRQRQAREAREAREQQEAREARERRAGQPPERETPQDLDDEPSEPA